VRFVVSGVEQKLGGKAEAMPHEMPHLNSAGIMVASMSRKTEASRDSHSRKAGKATASPIVSIIMGSKSDWETMQAASEMLAEFGVAHECRVVSAHRTPELMAEVAAGAEGRGIEVIIAGAGGAAHLPGMTAAHTTLPVLGVPVESRSLKGLDSLLSIVQMPAGVPVATLAIGTAGAKNAALLAVAILANKRRPLREKLKAYREELKRKVLEESLS
jgi:5-(carboxyamino)imidazole ribonucleotide mutase